MVKPVGYGTKLCDNVRVYYRGNVVKLFSWSVDAVDARAESERPLSSEVDTIRCGRRLSVRLPLYYIINIVISVRSFVYSLFNQFIGFNVYLFACFSFFKVKFQFKFCSRLSTEHCSRVQAWAYVGNNIVINISFIDDFVDIFNYRRISTAWPIKVCRSIEIEFTWDTNYCRLPSNPRTRTSRPSAFLPFSLLRVKRFNWPRSPPAMTVRQKREKYSKRVIYSISNLLLTYHYITDCNGKGRHNFGGQVQQLWKREIFTNNFFVSRFNYLKICFFYVILILSYYFIKVMQKTSKIVIVVYISKFVCVHYKDI